ncbi:NAD(P)/FAD-dependent oxidoreductase [Leptolyngbya sp. FACHB-261]|uniref:NAD(P)/FAD-dependent oxidoreductase n=1 Tax=Leptolyngbya sp. FACHB-261 TaxID=2692806 RepID=UPI0016883BC3|nr:NAD(P)/FAD-dependent oxidoreductase [Leptolyngbya sp. FACHB-261]MBD2104352.1 NAD(P)/FAD-dependent oxidoreductase [Leptolyngbya sp. FACHB-261]
MTQQICILGGGFGGLYTALNLSRLPWKAQQPEIVLVDQSDCFVFTPLLYELLTGELQTWEIAPPFQELLANTGVRFLQGVVTGIDLAEHRVELTEGPELTYDRLVLALGGEPASSSIPGVAEHTYAFRSVADARRLEERLRVLEEAKQDKIRIVIIGAGPSGVELACKLADRLGDRGRVRLVDYGNQIVAGFAPTTREAAQKALERRQIWLNLETKVLNVSSDAITLEYRDESETLPVDLVLWAAGTTVPDLVRTLPLKHNERGQVVAESTLQVPDHADLFALGDLAESHDADGQLVPITAQAAFQQAEFCAWNVWASLNGRPLLSFRYLQLGELLTLGEDAAAFSGLGLNLDGPLAYLVRRVVYLGRMPTLEHQIKVGLNWITRPVLEALSQFDAAVAERQR